MPYDDTLADRLRTRLHAQPGYEEKRMMGGLCLMVNGKMLLGVMGDELMVRIDRADQDRLLEAHPAARVMAMAGRRMDGYLLVEPTALRTAAQLEFWVGEALAFNPRAKARKK